MYILYTVYDISLIPFHRPVKTRGAVEQWLATLEQTIVDTIKRFPLNYCSRVNTVQCSMY